MKVALVTGASRGIGQAISLQLKEDGYRVLGTATTSSGIKSLKDKGIEGLELDLNSPNSKETFWQEIESKEVNISILVNNAGITRDNIVLRMSDNEWQDIMNVNLNGAFYLTKKILKMMLKLKWGRVINITSTSASIGNNLINPIPLYSFPGLKAGDKWCLCVSRWVEAERAGKAPKVILEATHEKTLKYTSLETLIKYAFVNN